MKTLIVIMGAMLLPGLRDLQAQTNHLAFSKGDVFVATGDGKIQWRQPNGLLIKVLDTGIANTALDTTSGMAFDLFNNLYVTAFNDQNVYVFDETGKLLGTFGSGFTALPESMLIDAAGNVYVGQASPPSNTPILKFDAAGNLLNQFFVAIEDRGSDWIELAADQCTMFYTSEGTLVKRFNVCTGTQLPDFNTTPLPGTFAYALRLLPDGGLLVADNETIVRLDASGSVIQSYDASGDNQWFALNLDPDGTSFWSSTLDTHDVVKFDIASGNVLVNFSTGPSPRTIAGITVNGELTASRPPLENTGATRTARFWFTHATTNDPSCVTLLNAFQSGGAGKVNLGFLILPTTFRNGDAVLDAADAVIEALGFYWKSASKTGEDGGTQNRKLKGSSLCKEKKRLAVELIAAIGNTILLGTTPSTASYVSEVGITNFPSDLLARARLAVEGDDIVQVRSMTALLQKFNSSGVTNDFRSGLVECSSQKPKILRKLARDATTQTACAGGNNNCDGAEAVIFPNSSDPFASATFTRSINLSKNTDKVQSPTCGAGGRDAIWQVKPTVGTNGRQFTVATAGSNFDTMISVWTGICSNLTEVSCVDDAGIGGESLSFTTDGTNTFRIVVEGAAAKHGKLKVQITSP